MLKKQEIILAIKHALQYNKKKNEVHTMLFQKKQERKCSLCIHATLIDNGTINCQKKGIKNGDDKCLHFTYDPCKRKPAKAKAIDFAKFEEYDYSL
jgi:hypothetical protein